MTSQKVFITAAVTGAVHTPSLSPYLPCTPEEIIEDAVTAAEAGAAIVHIHARDPQTGAPSSDIPTLRKIVQGIKARSNVVIGITTGGSTQMTLEERLKAIPELAPELASCNAGSINFCYSDLAAKMPNPRHDWEIPYVQRTEDVVFANTFKAITHYVNTMKAQNTLPEFEVYDVGMINNIAYLQHKGVITGPVYLQFVMGVLGGIPATVRNLCFLYETAASTLKEFTWSCAAAGRNQIPLMAVALSLGGNARVGLEDSLYIGAGTLAKSSAEQVERVCALAGAMGRDVASPDDARRILRLKGPDQIGF